MGSSTMVQQGAGRFTRLRRQLEVERHAHLAGFLQRSSAPVYRSSSTNGWSRAMAKLVLKPQQRHQRALEPAAQGTALATCLSALCAMAQDEALALLAAGRIRLADSRPLPPRWIPWALASGPRLQPRRAEAGDRSQAHPRCGRICRRTPHRDRLSERRDVRWPRVSDACPGQRPADRAGARRRERRQARNGPAALLRELTRCHDA